MHKEDLMGNFGLMRVRQDKIILDNEAMATIQNEQVSRLDSLTHDLNSIRKDLNGFKSVINARLVDATNNQDNQVANVNMKLERLNICFGQMERQ